MNTKAIEQISNAVTALRANHFETLSGAAVFCAAASATVNGTLSGVSEISRVTRLPISTVSRLVRQMNQRGLLVYTTHIKDRRKRLVRARIECFK